MINSWQWRDNVIYAAVIYGGQYITLVSFYASFDDVLDAIIEKGREDLAVQDGTPIIFLSSGYMDEDTGTRMVQEQLVNLDVRR